MIEVNTILKFEDKEQNEKILFWNLYMLQLKLNDEV